MQNSLKSLLYIGTCVICCLSGVSCLSCFPCDPLSVLVCLPQTGTSPHWSCYWEGHHSPCWLSSSLWFHCVSGPGVAATSLWPSCFFRQVQMGQMCLHQKIKYDIFTCACQVQPICSFLFVMMTQLLINHVLFDP